MSKLESGKKLEKIDLDQILVDEIGQFGKFQIITLFLAAFPIIFIALASGEYIFTTARINTRCLIPQCDSSNPEFAPSWVLNAIPGTSPTSFDACQQYGNSSLQQPAVEGTCPANLFDTTTTLPCNDYVYENQLSVVYDFDMGCDEWRRSRIGSIRILGMFLCLPITGYISDRWGRKVALVINAFNTGWIGLARSFVNSYEWFLALEVIETILGGGVFSSSFIFLTELVGPKYRVIMGNISTTFYSLGQILIGLIAWRVPHWRSLTQTIYAPQFLILIYFWIFSESVRWLLSKGRYEEAETILKKVAKTNNTVLSKNSLEALRATAEAEKLVPKSKDTWLPLQVIRSRIILSRCLVTPFWWVTNTLVYFGMSINSVNLSGNMYLNYVAVAAIDIPGYWVSTLLLDRIGRKPVLIGFYLLCAACQFGFAFMPKGQEGLSLFLYLFGKFCIAIVMSSIYIYTAELYPTKYRHNLFAYSLMVGRIGSITAPLTPAFALEVWDKLPSVLFGGFALVSGLLVFTTPETLGTKLPDTMEDAEQLSNNKTEEEI